MILYVKWVYKGKRVDTSSWLDKTLPKNWKLDVIDIQIKRVLGVSAK